MFEVFYEKIIKASKHKNALYVFLILAFLESFISPIPPDIMMATMIAANRSLLRHLGWMAGIVSSIGGAIGYSIGYYCFALFGEKILSFYHINDSFAAFSETFGRYGFLIISLKGISPIPFKFIAITAGIAQYDFKLFFIATCIARFSKFYLVTILIWYMGEHFHFYLKKYFSLFVFLSIVAILLGFGLLRLI